MAINIAIYSFYFVSGSLFTYLPMKSTPLLIVIIIEHLHGLKDIFYNVKSQFVITYSSCLIGDCNLAVESTHNAVVPTATATISLRRKVTTFPNGNRVEINGTIVF